LRVFVPAAEGACSSVELDHLDHEETPAPPVLPITLFG